MRRHHDPPRCDHTLGTDEDGGDGMTTAMKSTYQVIAIAFLGMLIGVGIMYGVMIDEQREEKPVEMRTLKEMVVLADDIDELTWRYELGASQTGRQLIKEEERLLKKMTGIGVTLRKTVLEDIKGR